MAEMQRRVISCETLERVKYTHIEQRKCIKYETCDSLSASYTVGTAAVRLCSFAAGKAEIAALLCCCECCHSIITGSAAANPEACCRHCQAQPSLACQPAGCQSTAVPW